jgi:hypothetical protein
MLHHVVWYKFANVSEVFNASIIGAMRMMRAEASTSEMSETDTPTTWCNIPEDSNLLRNIM